MAAEWHDQVSTRREGGEEGRRHKRRRGTNVDGVELLYSALGGRAEAAIAEHVADDARLHVGSGDGVGVEVAVAKVNESWDVF